MPRNTVACMVLLLFLGAYKVRYAQYIDI
jgi:hypothetical protein